jgi:hypothetical protein
MVRPIIIHTPERIFYGAREAYYTLSLNETNLENFASDLQKSVATANSGKDSHDSLYFRHSGRIIEVGISRTSRERSELVEALNDSSNIFLSKYRTFFGEFMIANFISRFCDEDKHKDRTLHIPTFSAPNEVFDFDQSFLYKIGEKYGKLTKGEDFDIIVGAYKKVEVE